MTVNDKAAGETTRGYQLSAAVHENSLSQYLISPQNAQLSTHSALISPGEHTRLPGIVCKRDLGCAFSSFSAFRGTVLRDERGQDALRPLSHLMRLG